MSTPERATAYDAEGRPRLVGFGSLLMLLGFGVVGSAVQLGVPLLVSGLALVAIGLPRNGRSRASPKRE